MELYQEEKSIILNTNCYDDLLKTYFKNKGIYYFSAFIHCWGFTYNQGNPSVINGVSVPATDFSRYKKIGIQIEKREVNDVEIFLKIVSDKLSHGDPVIAHFDCFYCPWDPMFNNKKRNHHNSHAVMITDIDVHKKVFIVADPYFQVKKGFLPFEIVGKGCKFYLHINSEEYENMLPEQIHFENLYRIAKEKPFLHMQKFLNDFEESLCSRIDSPWIFDNNWKDIIQRIALSRHYVWIFYRILFQETKNPRYEAASVLLNSELQSLNYCTRMSYKSGGLKNKRLYIEKFMRSFQEAIYSEEKAFTILSENFKPMRVLKGENCCLYKNQKDFNLTGIFNSRGSKKNIRESKEADLTGRHEYIIPKRRNRKYVRYGNTTFSVHFGSDFDNVKCMGQEIWFNPKPKVRGIGLLMCSEWGTAQMHAEIQTETGIYYTEYIVRDFKDKLPNAVQIGKTYLHGETKDHVFRKKIFFRVGYFIFPKTEQIKKIKLPDCDSLHIFSMVFINEECKKSS